MLLGLAGAIERFDQLVRVRNSLRANLNRLSLFRWNRKPAAAFHLSPRRFPPLFPFRFAEKIGHHPVADLLRSRVAFEAFQDISNNRDRIFFGQFFRSFAVARFAREEMLRRNDDEIFRGVLELHRMTFFRCKVDHHLIQKQVPLGDSAKSPTLVQAKSAGLQRVEFFRRF